MLYITQLVYVHPGKESAFEEFEAVACERLLMYGGQMLLRLRPTPESVVAAEAEVPYEVHFLRFENAADLARYTQDEERQRVLHLKADAVRASLLVQGTRLD